MVAWGWWPTNILSNALQTLRTAQFDTHIHTGTDARTTNTISLTNEIHAKIIRHKNTFQIAKEKTL